MSGYRGSVNSGHSGPVNTEEQRNRGTEEQRNRGTEEQWAQRTRETVGIEDLLSGFLYVQKCSLPLKFSVGYLYFSVCCNRC